MIRISKSYKNLKRYKQIGEILIKYGFDFIVVKLIEKKLVPSWIIKKQPLMDELSDGKRLRLAFEELGPTFIKLGQILSTRADLLSEDILLELSILQDNAPEFPYAYVEDIFEKEFGISIDKAFIEFDKGPMAAASIGQVHGARLHEGLDVVVKIKRPYIDEIIQRDIEILINMGKVFDDYVEDDMPFKMKDIAKEFSNSILRELDFTHEARNTEKFLENFKNDSDIIIPSVFWKYSSKRILTIARVDGLKVTDILNSGYNIEEIKHVADTIAKNFMKQVFIHGLFHGDPHPGNIFILAPNKVAFIDFGITGYLDNRSMTLLANLFIAGARKDVDKIVDLLVEIDAVTEATDSRTIKEDISFLLSFYFNTPLKRLNMQEAVSELMRTAYRNSIKLPPQFTLLAKALITLEGCVKVLNPEFSISSVARGFIREIMTHRLQPKTLLLETSKYMDDIMYTLRTLPKSMKTIIKKAERNEIRFIIEHKGISRLENEINKFSNKLSISLIISSVIIGSSLILQSSIGPLIWGLSFLGLIGYTASIISIFFLILLYRRSGNSSKR